MMHKAGQNQVVYTLGLTNPGWMRGLMTCPADPEENSPGTHGAQSARARMIQRALEAVHAAPEVREDRVEAARHALATGTLQLDGQALADAILRQATER